MKLDDDALQPLYMRIAQWLEDEILNGSLKEDERIYSQYQLAEMFNINPATAAKGLNLLADEGTIYKKRGLGMFIAQNARERILAKRRGPAFEEQMLALVREAKRLSVDADTLTHKIRKLYEGGENI